MIAMLVAAWSAGWRRGGGAKQINHERRTWQEWHSPGASIQRMRRCAPAMRVVANRDRRSSSGCLCPAGGSDLRMAACLLPTLQFPSHLPRSAASRCKSPNRQHRLQNKCRLPDSPENGSRHPERHVKHGRVPIPPHARPSRTTGQSATPHGLGSAHRQRESGVLGRPPRRPRRQGPPDP